MNNDLHQIIKKAKERGLLNLKKADGRVRFDCLKDKCALCCSFLGSPSVTDDEITKIGENNITRFDSHCFVKSDLGTCILLKNGLCSKYPSRPLGCREYPWYNIDGQLYYDAGCPGIKYDYADKPDVNTIGPIQRFGLAYTRLADNAVDVCASVR